MSFVYEQGSGRLMQDGLVLAAGYAGKDEGKNNPEMQEVHCIGPIPRGLYTIEPPVDTRTHGPYVLWLTPDPANQMFGRSAFGIHGDSLINPGCASEGCIIMPRTVRERVGGSGDNQLEVV